MKGFLFFLVFFLLFSELATAASIPTFPACASTQGILKVNYSEGTHGIVGESGSFSGRDTVYSLTSETLTQCFCSVDGNGIQTNWWKVASLTDDEVTLLRSRGWHYVPNGALWGLEEAPYLALNADYSCKPQGEVQSSSSTSSDPGDSNSKTNSSNGQVLGTTTANGQILASTTGQVLGLATTGNFAFILAIGALGIVSIGIGGGLIRSS